MNRTLQFLLETVAILVLVIVTVVVL